MINSEHKFDLEAEKQLILKHYRALLKSVKPRLSNSDSKRIRRAFEMALDSHEGMRRKSGEPYILHPIAVARIVSEEIGLEPTSIICALLHDVVEDTELTLDDIEQSFDKETAKIIDGLTKISGVFDLKDSIQAENFRKLLLTLTDDIRVILIKLADRLHNMRTLGSMPRQKQLKISSETSFLYAPLAHRMGLYNIKTELEDLSMKYREPEQYKSIATKLNATKRARSSFIKKIIDPIREVLDKTDIKYRVYGRPKSIHSIANKMRKKGVEFEDVFDLMAIRIIIDADKEEERAQCWNVFSTITSLYQSNPKRMRDWLSNPKTNGYEALHATVSNEKGKWVEVQIRSERMHAIAEKGVAAHWKYKEGEEGNNSESAIDKWVERVQEMLQDPDTNALELLNDFKLDLDSEEVFVFTPNGELRRLRKDATALDFAFEIHSEIGKQCIGAKVNYKLVPLSHVLQNGDQVEILTSRKQKPTEDWLSFVVTGKASAAIKQALKSEKKKVAQEGKEIVKRKFKQQKLDYSDANFLVCCDLFKLSNPFEFFYQAGKKKIDFTRLKELDRNGKRLVAKSKKPDVRESLEENIAEQLRQNADLLILGSDSSQIAYKFANCCNPIPGDDVFGFITIGEGIKIHRVDCPNAVDLMSKYSYRIVKSRWTHEHDISFLTALKISGIDDVGVVKNMTDIISGQLKLNMRSMSIESEDGIFEGKITIYVNDQGQLDALINKLKNLDGVLSVSRVKVEEEKKND